MPEDIDHTTKSTRMWLCDSSDGDCTFRDGSGPMSKMWEGFRSRAKGRLILSVASVQLFQVAFERRGQSEMTKLGA